jgi:hypothetical protein
VDIPANLSNVVAISAGAAHNIALRSDGTVVAWGLNIYGQTNVPVGLSNVVAIAAGGWHNLALKSDGTVVAWGAGGPNTNALVVYGQNVVPQGLSNVVQVAAGFVHSLALVGTVPPTQEVQLEEATIGTNGFSLSVPSRPGRVYTLEFKNSLTNTDWTALPLVAGTGQKIRLSDPTVSSKSRLYRVKRW